MMGAVQDGRGVERRACGHSSMRNRRDPFPAAKSGEGDPYKPRVKQDRAGRESEGPVLPSTPGHKAGQERVVERGAQTGNIDLG